MTDTTPSEAAMNQPAFQRRTKQIALLALVGLLVALSWARPIDDLTVDYINQSIATAAVIFGVSRAINAAVSVTQSAHVGIGVASVAPGEALDPINDLIERFSEVMTISITSLVFQRVLLEVATHWIFNALVTLAALAVLAALLLRRYQTVTLKTFAVLVVVRLFLSTVILANSAVDYVFLDSQVKEGEKKIDAIKSEVSAVSAIAGGQGAAVDERITQIGGELGRHQQERTELAHDLRAAEAKIMELESQKPKHPWWKPEVLNRDPKLKALDAKIDEEHVEIARIKSRQRDLDKADSLLNEERACLEKRTRGETCSWFEKIRTTGDWFKMPSLDIEDKIDSLITVMALIMLRSILLPLFFWVVIYKTIRWIWTKQTDLRFKAPPSFTDKKHTANSGRAEPPPHM